MTRHSCHLNSSRRNKRLQWIRDARLLGCRLRIIGAAGLIDLDAVDRALLDAAAEQVASLLHAASIARRERRLARRRAA